jgi:hypothetical protein
MSFTTQQWVTAFSQVLNENGFKDNTKSSYLSVLRKCLETASAHEIAQPAFPAKYARPDRKYKGLIAGTKVFGKHFQRVCAVLGVDHGAGTGSAHRDSDDEKDIDDPFASPSVCAVLCCFVLFCLGLVSFFALDSMLILTVARSLSLLVGW